MTPDFPDEFGEYLAEQMQDPSFAEAYRLAEERAAEEQALAGARWLARWWLVAGVTIGAVAAYLTRSPWSAMALAPWAVCQAAERWLTWELRRR